MIGHLVGDIIDVIVTKDTIRDAIERKALSRHKKPDEAKELSKNATSLYYSAILCKKTYSWVGIFGFFLGIGAVGAAISIGNYLGLIIYIIVVLIILALLVYGIYHYVAKADKYLMEQMNVSIEDIANMIQKEAEEAKEAEEKERIERKESRQEERVQNKNERSKRKLTYECKKCKIVTKYGSKYCTGCGKKIDWDKLLKEEQDKNSDYYCSGCGAEINSQMKYCPGCGKEISW